MMTLSGGTNRQYWVRRSIESLCMRVTTGGTPYRNNPEFYRGGTIRWVKTKELKDWYVDDTEEKITEDALASSSAKLLPADTVLMAMYGDGRTITSLGILRSESACNQASCAMVADPSVCNYLFLFYSLKYHREDFILLASGGAQRNLNGKTIREFEIAVPDRQTQDRIASVLSAYDDLIETNARRITILEEMAQMIYREWFVNYRFPGHAKVRMVESEIGPIPAGWKVEPLRELTSLISRGISPLYDDAAKGLVINQKCIRDGRLGLEPSRKQSKKVPEDKLIRLGDILINSTGVGTLGRVAQVLESISNCTVDSHVSIVRPRNNSEFLGKALLQLEQHFERLGIGSTGQTELSRERIGSTLLVIPTSDWLERYSRLVAPMNKMIVCCLARISNLRQTRDLLLPKLVSGEVGVEQFEAEALAQGV
jgi:type I restriction enzyme S subunit